MSVQSILNFERRVDSASGLFVIASLVIAIAALVTF
jgi:hypothetical protein